MPHSASMPQLANKSAAGFKGVTKSRQGVFRARIFYKRHNIHLGEFGTEVEAARAYDAASLMLYQRIPRLNLPQGYNLTGSTAAADAKLLLRPLVIKRIQELKRKHSSESDGSASSSSDLQADRTYNTFTPVGEIDRSAAPGMMDCPLSPMSSMSRVGSRDSLDYMVANQQQLGADSYHGNQHTWPRQEPAGAWQMPGKVTEQHDVFLPKPVGPSFSRMNSGDSAVDTEVCYWAQAASQTYQQQQVQSPSIFESSYLATNAVPAPSMLATHGGVDLQQQLQRALDMKAALQRKMEADAQQRAEAEMRSAAAVRQAAAAVKAEALNWVLSQVMRSQEQSTY